MIPRLPFAVMAAALFAVAGTASQPALAGAPPAPKQGEVANQATSIREVTSNAITTTVISTIRRGYLKSIRKTFGLRFVQRGTLPSTTGGARDLGMAAGDEGSDISTWVNTGYQNYHADAGGVSSKSNIYAGLVGMDYAISERYIVGVSAGYTTSRTRSDFVAAGGGGTVIESNSTLDDWTIASYGAALLTDNFFIDVTAGATFEEQRLNTLTDTNLVTESGDQDALTTFVSINFNYAEIFENWIVSGSIGFNYSKNRAKAFTSDQGIVLPGSVQNDSSMTVGGELGYQLDGYIPYVLGAIEADLASNPRGGGDFLRGYPAAETDEIGIRLGSGVDFDFRDNIVGSFELSNVLGKKGVVDSAAFLNLHITF